MAQNITLMGASYSNVPAVKLPKTGGGTAQFDDTTDADATASDITSGKTAYVNGVKLTGTNSGGGASSWKLLGSKEFTASTTSTSNSSVGSISCGSEASTKDKIIYVRVRDKAGPRAGYFYGSDVFFINANKANASTSAFTLGARAIIRYTTSSQWGVYSGTGYGVFGYSISNAGAVNIYKRYNSSNSLTIDGTYICEVYALDYPDGVSPFDA